MKRAFALLLCTSCSLGLGTPSQRLVGAAPKDPELVASCKSTQTAHNVLTVLAGAAGGAGGLTGAGEKLPNLAPGVSTGLEISAVALAVVALGSIIGGSIAGNSYADNRCIDVLAP
jgi:hypothetical protein